MPRMRALEPETPAYAALSPTSNIPWPLRVFVKADLLFPFKMGVSNSSQVMVEHPSFRCARDTEERVAGSSISNGAAYSTRS